MLFRAPYWIMMVHNRLIVLYDPYEASGRYLHPSDNDNEFEPFGPLNTPQGPSRPLKTPQISHDAIVPGISQEQQHHSKLSKDCFRSHDYHLNTSGTHQNPTAPFSSIYSPLGTLTRPYQDSITYTNDDLLFRKNVGLQLLFFSSQLAHLVNFYARN